MMPATTATTGMVVEIMPSPMPDMMTVAGPVLPLSDNFWVGR